MNLEISNQENCPKKIAQAFVNQIPETDRRGYLSLTGEEFDREIYENFFPIVGNTLNKLGFSEKKALDIGKICNHIRDKIMPFNYVEIYQKV